MRNMLEYPITQQEVIDLLDRWLERWDRLEHKPIGSIEPFIVEALKRLVSENWSEVKGVFEITRRGQC